MRHYECECLKCGRKAQIAFPSEPYPEIGEAFVRFCPSCSEETQMTRVLTRKAAAELRRRQIEVIDYIAGHDLWKATQTKK